MRKRRERTNFCPVGLECLKFLCPNRSACKDLTISWALPYQRKSDGLYVREYGTRWTWTDEDRGLRNGHPRCSLPFGDYKAEKDYSPGEGITQRITEAWLEAGFQEAWLIEHHKRCRQEELEAYLEGEIDEAPDFI